MQENTMQIKNELEYYMEPLAHKMTVFIDEEVTDPSYYRGIVKGIDSLGEYDVVEFNIASIGGNFTGLQTLVSAIQNSPATTVANIRGECHSSASMLALSCDELHVFPLAEMLVHYVSFGAGGPGNHVSKQVQHIDKMCSKVFKEIYTGFLSEEEIKKCIEEDYQLWLTSEEITERLKNKIALAQESEQGVEEPSAVLIPACEAPIELYKDSGM